MLDYVILIAGLLWLVAPLVGANIWRRKGGHEAVGCLAGLILGPLAFLLTAVEPRRKDGE